MGKLLTIQVEDDEKIESLKIKLHARTKIEVVRFALDLLEKEILRKQTSEKWKRAAGLVAKSSNEVNKEFRKNSRLKKVLA